MENVVFVLQILMWFLCPAVIGLILLQGAAGDISSAFGGGGQLDASLGVGAHRKMAQVTGVLAVVFFVIVLVLAYPHRKSFRDMKNAAAPATTTPAAPAPAAPAPSAPVLTPVPAPAPAVEAPAAPAPTAEAQPTPAPVVEAQPTPAPAAEAAPAQPTPAGEAAPAPAPAEPSKP